MKPSTAQDARSIIDRHAVIDGWRRPQAPIAYPYGDPPTGPDTRMPASDILPSPPLSSMPLSRRRVVEAIRYRRYEEADARMDVLQRIGHLDRCGADDDPPVWRWPYQPD
jgi:hypothetical protein